MKHEGQYVKAIYEFKAQGPGELSLSVGDILRVTNEDGNWLQGEAINGSSGLFPSNYVENIVLPDVRMGQRIYVALSDFQGDQAGDLELTKGDIILGLEPVDDNWWKGKNGPLRGIFPLSYVHELVIPIEGPRARSASLQHRSASLQSNTDTLASKTKSEMIFARALVDVTPQIEGELGFQVGDFITVLEFIDEDWFYGECHNQMGVVSTICVEFLDDLVTSPGDDTKNLSHSGDGSLFTSGNISGKSQVDEQGKGEQFSSTLDSNYSDKDHPLHSVSYTRENTEVTPYAKTLFPFQAELPNELSFGENEIVTLIQHVNKDWIEGELDGQFGVFPASFVEIIVDCPHAYDKLTNLPETQHSNVCEITLKNEKESQRNKTLRSNTDNSVSSFTELNKNIIKNDESHTDSVCIHSRADESSVPHSSVSSTQSVLLHSERGQISLKNKDSNSAQPTLGLVLHSYQGEVKEDLTVREGETIEILNIIDSEWLQARKESGATGLIPQNHVEIIGEGPNFAKLNENKENSEVHSLRNSGVGNGELAVEFKDKWPDVLEKKVGVVPISSDDNKHSYSADGSVLRDTVPADVSTETVQSFVVSPTFLAQSTNTVLPIFASNSTLPTIHDTHSRLAKPETKLKPPLIKPKPLPKPKLISKPVIKPKPSIMSKLVIYNQSTFQVPLCEQIKSSKNVTSEDNSLESLVEVELRKAKSEGHGLVIGSKVKDRTSNTVPASEKITEQSSVNAFSHSQSAQLQMEIAAKQNCGSSSKESSGLISSDEDINASKSESSNEDMTCLKNVSDGQSVSPDVISRTDFTSEQSSLESRPVQSTQLTHLPVNQITQLSVLPINHTTKPSLLPRNHINRSASDDALSSVSMHTAETAKPAHLRYSLPVSQSVHEPSKVKKSSEKQFLRNSFINQAYEHEEEGQLVLVDTPRPAPPNRPLPLPPHPSIPPAAGTHLEQLPSVDSPRKMKRPPPRPMGPRMASVPSKVPLQPVRLDSSKPVPHRRAPPVPEPRRPTPLVSCMNGSVSFPVSSKQILGSTALTTPPKRPPPILPDLMRFSPEPLSNEEGCAEVVADLKKRIQETEADIKKYEQSRQELETKLSQHGEEDGINTLDSLEFISETLKGLHEEHKRLKGNLFGISPYEEHLEKSKLLAERKAAEEQDHILENEKRAEELCIKRREKREKVLQELIDTEKDFHFDLQLCLNTFFESLPNEKVPEGLDLEFLFGNMEEILDVSQRLLTSLESAINGKEFQHQIVGTTFVALAEDMKNTFAPYCRHHDDVITVLEKYKEMPEICEYFAAKVEEMRKLTNVFDIEAILIKPVQRVLKYPLLLNELAKCTEDDHPDKVTITNAIQAMTDVATAINEYKRRKDLVYKYKKDSDETFSMKIAKLNLHSIKKKSSRMRGRLSTNLGIGLQLRDEHFEMEESRFRSVEKAVKVLLRSVMVYKEQLREVASCQENVVADVSDYYGEEKSEEITAYIDVHEKLKVHYKKLVETVEDLVITPLSKLVIMMNGPNKIIEKRFDKLLDYNNLLGRDKEEKIVQAAKNDYEAMNAQLLDELPKLYQVTLTLMHHCMSAYVRAQRDFMDHALKDNCILLELPSVSGVNSNIMECFNIQYTTALDHISVFGFIPRGFNPKMDSLRLDRKANQRPSQDGLKTNLPAGQSYCQSDSQKVYLGQMYGPDKLYCVTQTPASFDPLDMFVSKGVIVGVIKDKDPMGSNQRWFVDDGVNKGFVQSSVLVKVAVSPLDSKPTYDFSNSASVQSSCPDESDHTSTLNPLYPDIPDAALLPAAPPPYSFEPPPYEHYCAQYSFQARSNNEVSLSAGQTVIVLQKHDLDNNTEWWLVDANGYQGYAPANYLSKI